MNDGFKRVSTSWAWNQTGPLLNAGSQMVPGWCNLDAGPGPGTSSKQLRGPEEAKAGLSTRRRRLTLDDDASCAHRVPHCEAWVQVHGWLPAFSSPLEPPAVTPASSRVLCWDEKIQQGLRWDVLQVEIYTSASRAGEQEGEGAHVASCLDGLPWNVSRGSPERPQQRRDSSSCHLMPG